MTRLAFVDTETTGLDPDRHDVWEVGLVLADSSDLDSFDEHEWLLDASMARGDPMGLAISGFHQRHPKGWEQIREHEPEHYTNHPHFAIEFGRLTYQAHLVGAVPSFDEERLRKLLLGRGFQPGWHYHLIDVEAMAVGWLRGRHHIAAELPWRSDDISAECGVEPPGEDERHTALGDARWAWRWYRALVGDVS